MGVETCAKSILSLTYVLGVGAFVAKKKIDDIDTRARPIMTDSEQFIRSRASESVAIYQMHLANHTPSVFAFVATWTSAVIDWSRGERRRHENISQGGAISLSNYWGCW